MAALNTGAKHDVALQPRLPVLLLPATQLQSSYNDALTNVPAAGGMILTMIEPVGTSNYKLYLDLWNHRQRKWYSAEQLFLRPGTDYVQHEYGYCLTDTCFSTGTSMVRFEDFLQSGLDPTSLPCTLKYDYVVTPSIRQETAQTGLGQ